MSQAQDTPFEGDSQLPTGFQEVEAPSKFLEFAPGEEVRGTLGEPTTLNGKERFTLRVGGKEFVLPSHADLMAKVGELPPGANVLIRRTRDERAMKGGKRAMFLYVVAVSNGADAR